METLIAAKTLEPDALNRVKRWGLFGAPIAECPETGAQLRISKRRPAQGKAQHYIITTPCPAGRAKIGYVEAHSDQEAIEKANAYLASSNHRFKETAMYHDTAAHEPEDDEPGEPVNWSK